MPTLATDNFERADAPLTSAPWVDMPLYATNLAISGGNVVPSSYAGDAGSVYDGGISWPDDQWAQVVVGGLDGGSGADQGVGLLLRYSTASDSGYRIIVQGDGDVQINKIVTGTHTQIGSLINANFVNVDVLRAEIVGSTIRIYKNNVYQGGTTDTSVASGKPGIVYSSVLSGSFMNDFAAGDFNAAVIDVTQVNTNAGNGTTSVTVPADATLAVVFHEWWDSNIGNMLFRLHLGGASFKFQVTQYGDGGLGTDRPGIGVGWLDNLPGAGSQTLIWEWNTNAAITEGGKLFIVWVKSHHATAPIRDYALDTQQASTPVQNTLRTETDDLLLTMVAGINSTGDPDPTGETTKHVDGVLHNNYFYDVAEIPASAGSTTIDMVNEWYAAMASVSIRASDAAVEGVGSILVGDMGGDLIQVTPGDLLGSGAVSYAIIARTPKRWLHSGGAYSWLIAGNASAFVPLMCTAAGELRTYDGTNERSGPTLVTDEWYLIGFSKAAGTVTPEYHVYRYSTETWSHGNFSGTIANFPTTTSLVFMHGSGEMWLGNALVAAGWDSELADATFETLPAGLPGWLAADPDELWRFNAEIDLVSLTGTSVQENETNENRPFLQEFHSPEGWVDEAETEATVQLAAHGTGMGHW